MVVMHLSRLLGENRISQAELSRLTGIRPNTLNDLYHGVAERISFEHLDRICEALDCTITELLERKANPMKRTGNDILIEVHGNLKHKPEQD